MNELNKLKMRKEALLSSKGLTQEEEQNIDRVAQGHLPDHQKSSTQELIDQNYLLLQNFRQRADDQSSHYLPANNIASTFRTENMEPENQAQDLGAYLKQSQASIASSFPNALTTERGSAPHDGAFHLEEVQTRRNNNQDLPGDSFAMENQQPVLLEPSTDGRDGQRFLQQVDGPSEEASVA